MLKCIELKSNIVDLESIKNNFKFIVLNIALLERDI